MEKKGKQFIGDSKLLPANRDVRFENKIKTFILILIPFQFANKEARLASFKDWPAELEMKPEELAEAGFYHDPQDGNPDQVIGIKHNPTLTTNLEF